MSLLFPLGLLALLALPVIIWLHLRRSRLRRVTVPSLMLWKALPMPHPVKRRRWLPITLLLLLHLLIAGLIGFALAHPQGMGEPLNKTQHVAVVIDTTTSMGTRDTLSGTRLDAARSRVRSLFNTLSVDDRVTLIEAGMHARLVASGSVSNQATLLLALNDLAAGGAENDIERALTLARAELEVQNHDQPYDTTRIMILSDLDAPQDQQLDPRIEWVRLGGETDNRAIAAFAAHPRGNRQTAGHDLYVRIANYGNDALTTHFTLSGRDDAGSEETIDTRLIRLNPDGEVELTWELPGGTEIVEASVEGQDSLPDDDSATLVLEQRRPINTLLVSNSASPLERALNAVPEVGLVTLSPEEYETSTLVDKADLIVFNETITQTMTWPPGGVLVIGPPAAADSLVQVAGVQQADSDATLHIAEEAQPMLNRLSLGGVDFGPVAQVQVPPWAKPVLSYGDMPLIVRGRLESSEIALWTFDLDESNLTTRLAFPLLVARTVRDLVPPPLPEAHTSGTPLHISASPHAEQVEIRTPDGKTRTFDVTDSDRSFLLDNLVQPGLYTVREKSDGETIYEGYIPVNAGTPLESNVRSRLAAPIAGLSALPDAPASTAQAAQVQHEEQPLWPWLALAALLFVIIEWVYIHIRGQRAVGMRPQQERSSS